MRILEPVVSFVELFQNSLDISLHISVAQVVALLEIVSMRLERNSNSSGVTNPGEFPFYRFISFFDFSKCPDELIVKYAKCFEPPKHLLQLLQRSVRFMPLHPFEQHHWLEDHKPFALRSLKL
jgi:hypothetical protein